MTSNLYPKLPPDHVPIVGNRVAVQKRKEIDLHTVFDGKDGENVIRKTLTMMKYTVSAAFLFTGADVILLDRMGLLPTCRRALFWGIPIIGGGLAYTIGVAAIASLRKKDGRLNHFLGGMGAGTVVGAANKCVYTGVMSGLAIGAMGVLYKSSKMEGWVLFPDFPVQGVGYPTSYKYDFTLMKGERGNWVRELPKDTDCQ